MIRILFILLLSLSSVLAQMPEPVVLQYSVIPRSFQGVTIDVLVNGSTNYSSMGLSFTLQATVSPITVYDFQWQAVPGNPGSVVINNPTSLNTTVTVSVPGNYDFTAYIQRTPLRYYSKEFSVRVINTTNMPPVLSPIVNQSANQNTNIGPLLFTATDDTTPAVSLSYSFTSSNPTLLPVSGIVLGGSGVNRTLTLIPTTGLSGQSTVQMVVVDNDNLKATNTFTATWISVNHPPTLSGPTTITTPRNTPTSAVYTVGDQETPASGLSLGISSSSIAALSLSGSTSTRTLSIIPLLNAYGTNVLALQVSDGSFHTTTNVTLAVTFVNYAPIVGVISASSTPMNTPRTLFFTAADIDTPNLIYSASSSSESIVQDTNIVFSGSGTNRSVTLTPVTGASGSTTITYVVSDGSLSVTNNFLFTVLAAPNTSPVIAGLGNVTNLEDQVINTNNFYVNDTETLAMNLTVRTISSNPILVSTNNIALGGGGTNRTIVLTPSLHQSGSSTIQAIVTDGGGLTATNTFNAVWIATNYPPVVGSIPAQSINEDTSVTINFTASDVETAPGALTYAATASNPSLISSFTYGGSGISRTLRIVPATHAFGSTIITNSVSDGVNTTKTTFSLVVNFVNYNPIISSLYSSTNVTTNQVFSVALSVGDVETPVGSLLMSALSSNPSLVPVGNVVFGGSGAARTATVTPVNSAQGSATLTFIVTDLNNPPGQANISFTVTVAGGGGGSPTGYFVATNGLAGNTGTSQNSPWPLSKALQAGVVPSGKTVWMLPGTYVGSYGGAPNGVTFRPMPGAEWWMPNHVILDRYLDSCDVNFSNPNASLMMGSWVNTTWRDTEIRNSYPRCVIADGQNHARGELIRNLNGTPHGNMIYHNLLRDGMNNLEWEIHTTGTPDTFRGNISIFGGQPAHYEGGGMGGMWYLQNVMGNPPMRIEDNILGEGFNRLGELNGTSAGPQNNIVFDGNIGYGGGTPGCYALGCSMGTGFLVCTSNTNKDIWFINNCEYNWLQNYPPPSGPYNPGIAGGGVAFGKETTPFDHWNQYVSNNYICGSFALTIIQPRGSQFLRNTWISGRYAAGKAINVSASGNVWDANTYYYPGDEGVWRGSTPWTDAHEVVILGHPTENVIRKKVLVDPDGSGQPVMNLAIFNWHRDSSVQVDLGQDDYGTPFLANGKGYIIICTLNPLTTYTSGTKNGVTSIPVNTGFQLLEPAIATFYEGDCAGGDGIAAGLPFGGGHAKTTMPDFLPLQVIRTN